MAERTSSLACHWDVCTIPPELFSFVTQQVVSLTRYMFDLRRSKRENKTMKNVSVSILKYVNFCNANKNWKAWCAFLLIRLGKHEQILGSDEDAGGNTSEH